MKSQKSINRKRLARVRRTSAKFAGDAKRPRLAIFRSNKFIYAQLIDDAKHHTLASASTRDLKKAVKKSDAAREIGEALAKKATAAGIRSAIFDRRSYRYHGRVKALAEGARAGGLQF